MYMDISEMDKQGGMWNVKNKEHFQVRTIGEISTHSIEGRKRTMKFTKKLISVLLALTLLLSMAAIAYAQEAYVNGGSATITIKNAASGETYKLYKVFDASVDATTGSIVYTGTIPSALSDYFEEKNGYIFAKDAAYADPSTKAEMSTGLRDALKTWAETQLPVASETSDGSELSFKNAPYGYYVVTTTQGETAITVTSTTPNASIYDKNSTVPKDLAKTAYDENGYEIEQTYVGDKVSYTVTFKTANFEGSGADAKPILKYTIHDTLPEFLSDVTVDSIIVDNDGDLNTTSDQTNVTAQFDSEKKIVLDWYDSTINQFKYQNGALVVVKYTATVSGKADIDGDGNKNDVTVTWETEDGPSNDKLEESETIFTYAFAVKKVDDKGNSLAGAKFKLPFYVQETPDADGAYIYAGTTAGAGLINEVTTDANGLIIVKGLKSGEDYDLEETEAPAGYNKLQDKITITPSKTGSTTTNKTFYLDGNGDVVDTATSTTIEVLVKIDDLAATPVIVVNKTGTTMPSTGGVGTTLFYTVGGAVLACAVILLIAKKRSAKTAK